MRRFTTINDLVNYLFEVDHGFRDELTDEQMRDIAQTHRTNRYEEITDSEIDAMLVAAYMATGADETTALAMLRNR